jgi:hypothetical protein
MFGDSIKIIGGLCAMVLGVVIAAPQSFLWFKEMGRPKYLAGRLPAYSPEEHTDYIFTLAIGNKNITLDHWLPVLFAVGVLIVGAGAWGLWRAVKGS